LSQLKWWQKAVFYQIYPRSFADGNGDGIGDFKGMIDRLDYLKSLGVDGIWLSPHYPSPQHDCGYDISDYTAVAPEYGTLEEFKTFLDGLHRRGMYLILDLVLNHTSHLHSWFQESRSSRENPKRDWYIWQDGKNGNPPNRWYSSFGGSAWEFDPLTGQYYYHYFLKEQPDLNWRNPEVKQAMFDAVRFWLDLGVDGFRLDAIGTIYEDPALPDQPTDETLEDLYRLFMQATTPEAIRKANQLFEQTFKYQHDQPGIHELMRELRALLDQYPERILVGETDQVSFYGDGTNELHMVFNFPLMETQRLTAAWVRANQRHRLRTIPIAGWPCNTLGNHDSPRILSRFGDGQHNAEWARLCLALLLTLRGTPFLYNGEEIGMTDHRIQDLAQFRDFLAVNAYQMLRKAMGMPEEQALKMAASFTRDKNRTPMQWSHTTNAGFCPPDVMPWLPVNPNYAEGINVSEQECDPNSLLHYYRRMLAVRRSTPALVAGDYQPLLEKSRSVLAFLRSTPEQTCLVALNMSAKARTVNLGLGQKVKRLVFSSQPRRKDANSLDALRLSPFEVYVATLEGRVSVTIPNGRSYP